jgi:peptide/nickel transport system permease protein
MVRYALGRIGQALIVIWLAYTVVFLAVQLLPSDPVTIFLSADAAPDPAVVAAMKAQYGYDQPLIVQYLGQLGGLFVGDFGYALSAGQPVMERIGGVIGSTLELAGWAFVAAVLMSFVLVTLASLIRVRWVRAVLEALPPLFSAVPVFWIGLIALQVLSFQLGVMSIFPDGSFLSLLVPVVLLGTYVSAPIAQVLFKAVEQTYRLPFVDVLRAKGATEPRIYFGHILKNAVAPAFTVMAMAVGALLAGSVITETVFSRSGLGQVVLQGVTVQDIPLVQGLVLLTAAAFVVFNLIVDLLHPVLDPRVLIARPATSGRSQ